MTGARHANLGLKQDYRLLSPVEMHKLYHRPIGYPYPDEPPLLGGNRRYC